METASPLTRAPSGAQWTIEAEGQQAVVVEVGGGLRAYRTGGVEVLDGYAEDVLCSGGAGQVLVPWPDRIRLNSWLIAARSHEQATAGPFDRRASDARRRRS